MRESSSYVKRFDLYLYICHQRFTSSRGWLHTIMAKANDSNFREEPTTCHQIVLLHRHQTSRDMTKWMDTKSTTLQENYATNLFNRCGEHVWKRFCNLSRGGAFCDGCQHCETKKHTHRLNYSRLCTAIRMWRKLNQSTKNHKSFSVCAHQENAQWVRNITIDFNIFWTLVPSTTTFTKWL